MKFDKGSQFSLTDVAVVNKTRKKCEQMFQLSSQPLDVSEVVGIFAFRSDPLSGT